jgi:hypothetical protein
MLGFPLMTALGVALLSLREVLPDTGKRTIANASMPMRPARARWPSGCAWRLRRPIGQPALQREAASR